MVERKLLRQGVPGGGGEGGFSGEPVVPGEALSQDVLGLCRLGAAREEAVLRLLGGQGSRAGGNIRFSLPLPAEISIIEHLFTVGVQGPVIPLCLVQRGRSKPSGGQNTLLLFSFLFFF